MNNATHRSRGPVAFALLLALLPLLIGFFIYLGAAYKAVVYPFELDYGEGIVWQQLRQIVAGQAYGPIDVFPAIVFHYPPVYHLLTAAVASLSGLDQLAAGRLLSVIATIATGGVIAATVTRMTKADGGGRGALLCGLLAGLMVFSLMPVLHWSRFMRVDMVAYLFSFAGLYFGIRALTQPKAIHLAALCFVAAIFTKQTSIAAPIAVFGTLLLVRPRIAFSGIVTGAALSGISLGLLEWLTDGGFLRHILLYNINRFEPRGFAQVGPAFGQHALYFGVAGFGILHHIRRRVPAYRGAVDLAGIRRRLLENTADSQFVMVLAFMILATLMLVTVAKSGSNYNYYIEWLDAVVLLGGLGLRDAAMRAFGDEPPGGRARLTLVLPVAIAIQAYYLPNIPSDEWLMEPQRRPALLQLSTLVRTAQKPVISDEMVMLLKSGKPVLWEPSIFAELASKGVWDERPFVAKILHRDFAFFITVHDRGNTLFDSRYNPKVAAAIAAAYPRERMLAGYTLHFPAN